MIEAERSTPKLLCSVTLANFLFQFVLCKYLRLGEEDFQMN